MMNKPMSYYVKREHKAAEWTKKNNVKASKEVEKLLTSQRKIILERIDKFYADFADTYGMSEEKAKVLISQFDVNGFRQRAKEYVDNRDTSYIASYDMRLYDMKQRISRMHLLLNEINLDIAEMYDSSAKVLGKALSANQARELMRQANLFNLPQGQVKRASDALLLSSYRGTNFSSYWGKDLNSLYDIIDTAVKNAIFNGQHPDTIKNMVNKQFGTTDEWSKRLLITETTRIQSVVQVSAMQESGFDYFMFIAEVSACGKCQPFNSKVFPLSKWNELATVPPVHPNCRCSLVPAMPEDYEKYDESNEYRKLLIKHRLVV